MEAAQVKDVLAFLRILENPRDEVSWYRLLMLLPGIGDATARAAIDSMIAAAWESAAFGRYNPPPRARAAHAALVNLLDGLRNGPLQDEAQVSADIARVRLLYDNILPERYDRVGPRRRLLVGSAVPLHRPRRSRQHAARRAQREQRGRSGGRNSETTSPRFARAPSLEIQRRVVARSERRRPPGQASTTRVIRMLRMGRMLRMVRGGGRTPLAEPFFFFVGS